MSTETQNSYPEEKELSEGKNKQHETEKPKNIETENLSGEKKEKAEELNADLSNETVNAKINHETEKTNVLENTTDQLYQKGNSLTVKQTKLRLKSIVDNLNFIENEKKDNTGVFNLIADKAVGALGEETGEDIYKGSYQRIKDSAKQYKEILQNEFDRETATEKEIENFDKLMQAFDGIEKQELSTDVLESIITSVKSLPQTMLTNSQNFTKGAQGLGKGAYESSKAMLLGTVDLAKFIYNYSESWATDGEYKKQIDNQAQTISDYLQKEGITGVSEKVYNAIGEELNRISKLPSDQQAEAIGNIAGNVIGVIGSFYVGGKVISEVGNLSSKATRAQKLTQKLADSGRATGQRAAKLNKMSQDINIAKAGLQGVDTVLNGLAETAIAAGAKTSIIKLKGVLASTNSSIGQKISALSDAKTNIDASLKNTTDPIEQKALQNVKEEVTRLEQEITGNQKPGTIDKTSKNTNAANDESFKTENLNNEINLYNSNFSDNVPDNLKAENPVAWINKDGTISFNKSKLEEKFGVKIAGEKGKTTFDGLSLKQYIKKNPENGKALIENLKNYKGHEATHRVLELNGIDRINVEIDGQQRIFGQEEIAHIVDGSMEISDEKLKRALEKALQGKIGPEFKLDSKSIKKTDTKNINKHKTDEFFRVTEAAKTGNEENLTVIYNRLIDGENISREEFNIILKNVKQNIDKVDSTEALNIINKMKDVSDYYFSDIIINAPELFGKLSPNDKKKIASLLEFDDELKAIKPYLDKVDDVVDNTKNASTDAFLKMVELLDPKDRAAMTKAVGDITKKIDLSNAPQEFKNQLLTVLKDKGIFWKMASGNKDLLKTITPQNVEKLLPVTKKIEELNYIKQFVTDPSTLEKYNEARVNILYKNHSSGRKIDLSKEEKQVQDRVNEMINESKKNMDKQKAKDIIKESDKHSADDVLIAGNVMLSEGKSLNDIITAVRKHSPSEFSNKKDLIEFLQKINSKSEIDNLMSSGKIDEWKDYITGKDIEAKIVKKYDTQAEYLYELDDIQYEKAEKLIEEEKNKIGLSKLNQDLIKRLERA